MSTLKTFILEKVARKELTGLEAATMLAELNNMINDKALDDIAIIGMGCKLPESENVNQFWNNIAKSLNCIVEWPESRRKDFEHILKNQHYSELLFGEALPPNDVKEGMYIKGGYLQDIDKFDADFFGIPPREARYMDPRQRLILETTWNAIEDAGYGGNRIYGSNTGVFIGMENTNFTLYKFGTEPDPMHLTGGWISIHASRISYLYNLKGPCMILDTACSSGLASLHSAVQSIRNNECKMAIVGAINTSLNGVFKNHKEIVDLSSVQSKDGNVKTFDKDSNGTVWGEGVVMLVLKPMKDAIADRDNIHAVIKGSAMNNDGASNGITAPNAEAQENVIIKAWENAKVDPETINYVEAHGTGTILGDPIEIKGLTEAFRRHTNRKQFCAIGSLKPSMGHLVATSGLASLLKVVMAMKHKQLPPMINFESPNPYINFSDSPMYVNDCLRPWKREDTPRRAGINSFGFSGTNIHVVLEEYEAQHETLTNNEDYCVTISAKKESILKDYISNYKHFVHKSDDWRLADLAFTSNIGRGHYAYRMAIVAKDKAEFINLIKSIKNNDLTLSTNERIKYSYHKVVNDKKEKEVGEITMADKKVFSEKVTLLLNQKQSKKATLNDIAELYVKGADVDWKQFYVDEKLYSISAPVYPLEKIRCWADPKVSQVSKSYQGQDYGHLFVEKCLVKSLNHEIYQTSFSLDKHWVLSDHKIMGKGVIPGTTYLEIASTIAMDILGVKKIEFKDIFFLTPMFVEDNENKNVQTVIEKVNGQLKFSVISKNEDEWVKHVEGIIYPLDEELPSALDISELIKKYPVKYSKQDLIVTSDIFKFGPRWDTVVHAYRSSDDILIELALADNFKSDVDTLKMHPSLLDNAVNILSQSFGEGTYLPLNYKSLKLFSSIPSKLYSYVKRKNNLSGNLEVITFDITLCDLGGNVLAEITDYSIKRVPKSLFETKESAEQKIGYYEYSWKQTNLLAATATPLNGTYLVIHRNSDISKQVIDYYKAAGLKIIDVEYTSDVVGKDIGYTINSTNVSIDAMIEKIKGQKIERIINILPSHKSLAKYEDFIAEKENLLFSFFHLTKSMLKNKISPKNGIVIIGENINLVNGYEQQLSPLGNALFGLAGVVSKEYDALRCRCIDADSSIDIKQIVSEIELGNIDDIQIAYREGIRYQQMLGTTVLENKKCFEIKEGGTYLITGGTGGLGLEIAKSLSTKNKIKLGLINRSLFPSKDQWQKIIDEKADKKLIDCISILQKIEENGSEVYTYSADVGNLKSINHAITSVIKRFGSINGIIHAAGIAGDGFIMNKSIETFAAVLAPKIDGSWILNKLTENMKIDFNILFSSISTIAHMQGQGDYTAANAFLDGHAAMYRNNTTAINWPGWKETGMAADNNVPDDMALSKSISNASALKSLYTIMNSGKYSMMPAIINLPFLSANCLNIKQSNDLKKQVDQYRNSSKLKNLSNKNEDVVIKGKREEDLTATEKVMAQIWARVLGLDEVDVFDSFQELGGDSILATHLLKAILVDFPDSIDISDIFSYPSILQLSEMIDPMSKESEQISTYDVEESEHLKSLIDNVEGGNITVDAVLEYLSKS